MQHTHIAAACAPYLRPLPPGPRRAGHLTHGYYTYSKAEGTRKPVSATSVYFESLPYTVNPVRTRTPPQCMPTCDAGFASPNRCVLPGYRLSSFVPPFASLISYTIV